MDSILGGKHYDVDEYTTDTTFLHHGAHAKHKPPASGGRAAEEDDAEPGRSSRAPSSRTPLASGARKSRKSAAADEAAGGEEKTPRRREHGRKRSSRLGSVLSRLTLPKGSGSGDDSPASGSPSASTDRKRRARSGSKSEGHSRISSSSTMSAPSSPRGSVRGWGEWFQIEDEETGIDFFYNVCTNETTWDPPEGFPVCLKWGDWRQYQDPETKLDYYYNKRTQETAWDPPADFRAWFDMDTNGTAARKEEGDGNGGEMSPHAAAAASAVGGYLVERTGSNGAGRVGEIRRSVTSLSTAANGGEMSPRSHSRDVSFGGAETTGASTADQPGYTPIIKHFGRWTQLHDADSDLDYFFDNETGESSWDPPEDFPTVYRWSCWRQFYDPEVGLEYYFNMDAQETSWDAPSGWPPQLTADHHRRIYEKYKHEIEAKERLPHAVAGVSKSDVEGGASKGKAKNAWGHSRTEVVRSTKESLHQRNKTFVGGASAAVEAHHRRSRSSLRGSLIKKRRHLAGWVPRFYELLPEESALVYSSRDGGKEKGRIDLRGARVLPYDSPADLRHGGQSQRHLQELQQPGSAAMQGTLPRRRYCIRIVPARSSPNDGRPRMLAAQTEEERQAWIVALQSVAHGSSRLVMDDGKNHQGKQQDARASAGASPGSATGARDDSEASTFSVSISGSLSLIDPGTDTQPPPQPPPQQQQQAPPSVKGAIDPMLASLAGQIDVPLLERLVTDPASLPDDWQRFTQMDPSSGLEVPYYFNKKTRETTWEKPLRDSDHKELNRLMEEVLAMPEDSPDAALRKYQLLTAVADRAARLAAAVSHRISVSSVSGSHRRLPSVDSLPPPPPAPPLEAQRVEKAGAPEPEHESETEQSVSESSATDAEEGGPPRGEGSVLHAAGGEPSRVAMPPVGGEHLARRSPEEVEREQRRHELIGELTEAERKLRQMQQGRCEAANAGEQDDAERQLRAQILAAQRQLQKIRELEVLSMPDRTEAERAAKYRALRDVATKRTLLAVQEGELSGPQISESDAPTQTPAPTQTAAPTLPRETSDSSFQALRREQEQKAAAAAPPQLPRETSDSTFESLRREQEQKRTARNQQQQQHSVQEDMESPPPYPRGISQQQEVGAKTGAAAATTSATSGEAPADADAEAMAADHRRISADVLTRAIVEHSHHHVRPQQQEQKQEQKQAQSRDKGRVKSSVAEMKADAVKDDVSQQRSVRGADDIMFSDFVDEGKKGWFLGLRNWKRRFGVLKRTLMLTIYDVYLPTAKRSLQPGIAELADIKNGVRLKKLYTLNVSAGRIELEPDPGSSVCTEFRLSSATGRDILLRAQDSSALMEWLRHFDQAGCSMGAMAREFFEQRLTEGERRKRQLSQAARFADVLKSHGEFSPPPPPGTRRKSGNALGGAPSDDENKSGPPSLPRNQSPDWIPPPPAGTPPPSLSRANSPVEHVLPSSPSPMFPTAELASVALSGSDPSPVPSYRKINRAALGLDSPREPPPPPPPEPQAAPQQPVQPVRYLHLDEKHADQRPTPTPTPTPQGPPPARPSASGGPVSPGALFARQVLKKSPPPTAAGGSAAPVHSGTSPSPMMLTPSMRGALLAQGGSGPTYAQPPPPPSPPPAKLLCVVCAQRRKNVVFMPCGHISCCQACEQQCDVCPMCKRAITSRRRIVFSR